MEAKSNLLEIIFPSQTSAYRMQILKYHAQSIASMYMYLYSAAIRHASYDCWAESKEWQKIEFGGWGSGKYASQNNGQGQRDGCRHLYSATIDNVGAHGRTNNAMGKADARHNKATAVHCMVKNDKTERF